MIIVGPLTAEMGSLVWGTPANFNGFRVLASLLHWRRSIEVNETLHDVWPSPGLVHYTLCLRKRPPLTCYNIDINDPITINFGRSVTEKVTNQTVVCFPTSPIWWFCTTFRNRKPRNCIFLFNIVSCFANKYKTHSNYFLVAAEPTFIPKVMDCMHQTIKTYLEREHASCCLLPTCSAFTKSVTVSVAVRKMGVVLHQAWSES